MAETAEVSSGPRPFRGAPIWLPVFGVALGQRFVLPGASIADVALGIFTAIGLVHLARKARGTGPPCLPPWTKWLLALWAWAVVGGAVHVLYRTEPFSALEFSKSLAKLSFYALSVVVLAVVLRDSPKAPVDRFFLSAFAAAGALAIAIYALMLFNVPLPYYALWGHGPESAYYSDRLWPGGTGEFVRAQGLASEPSRLAYLQAMALAFPLLEPRADPRIGLRLAVILLSLLLTFSLTAYALLIPILGLGLFARWRAGRLGVGRRALALAALMLLLLLPLGPALQRTVVARAVRSVSGVDSSTKARIVGSWKMTYALLETNPLLGVGLGNFDVVAWEMRASHGHYVQKATQGWNTFAYVLATTGLPGLLLLLALLASAFRGRGRLAVPFVLGMFADGTFLGAAYWVFFAVYTTGDR